MFMIRNYVLLHLIFLGSSIANCDEICCKDLIEEKVQEMNRKTSNSSLFFDVLLCQFGFISGLNGMYTNGNACLSKDDSDEVDDLPVYRQIVNIGFKKLLLSCKAKYFSEVYNTLKKFESTLLIHMSWTNLKLRIQFDFIPDTVEDTETQINYLRSVQVTGFHLGDLEIWLSSKKLVFGFFCWLLTYPTVIRYILGFFGQIILEFYLDDIIRNTKLSGSVYYLHCDYF
uniref:Uncharacterized protein n=1 Tax=Strigamia maritima TaxID=126957 RepID=T1IM44_STRMM